MKEPYDNDNPENWTHNLKNYHTITSNSMVLCVMLDAVVLEPGHRDSALLDICKKIKADASQYPSKLSPAICAGAIQALHKYRPIVEKHTLNEEFSETANPDLILFELLEECLTDDFLPGQAPDAMQVTDEPFRVVNLAAVPHAWESAMSTAPLLDLARAANECDYFISYVRGFQGEAQAMPMVSDFLFVHTFTSHVTSVCIVIGLFMVPLGAAVTSEVPSIPFWLLSALVGGLLVLVWIWVLLSKHTSLVPQQMRPWALSQRTLWIDRYCIDHSSLTGMCSIGRCISKSNNMIVVANDEYFTNLLCVHELAVFSKLHLGSELKERLVLISSEWCGIFWLQKSVLLTHGEKKWLTDFRCDRAHCKVPAERQIIVSAICKVWGSLDYFEQFVHTELLYVLEESKKRYYQQSRDVVGEALRHVFAA